MLPVDESLSAEDRDTGECGIAERDEAEAGVIEVPWPQLSADSLMAVIEEFVSRDGTDYGDVEASMADKVEQVKAALASGHATLLFDPVAQSCHIVESQRFPR